MYAGKFIQSTSLLDDTNFEGTIIYITEYNANGSVGFIINKPLVRTLNQLVEFKQSISFPFYNGGPVDGEHLFFVHRRPDVVTGGTLVADGIYVGGDFKLAVTHINRKTLTGADIKLFIGYCGWDDGELENEIAEGSWVVIDEGKVF